MKRSEMVQWMVENWLGSFPECNVEKDIINTVTEGMDKLLTAIEYKGMLPPTIQGVYNTLLTPPTQNPSGTLDYGFHRGWEPES